MRDTPTWDWLYRGHLERYLVADAGEHLAAQYALLPLRVQHRDAVIDASLSLDTATHPNFTGRGLFTDLAQRAYERPGAELVFGFPNPSSAGIFYNRLGWHELAPFPLLFKPLTGLIRALAPPQLHSGAAVDRVAGPFVTRNTGGAERFDRFGEWADNIWQETSATLGTAVVRDAAYLNWRFADAPAGYERFAAPSGAEPTAFAVLRTVPWRRGSLSYLMELAAQPGSEQAAASVLAAAIASARAAGSAGIVALATPRNPVLGLLRRRGFRRPPERFLRAFSFGARLSGGLEADPELKRVEAWHITAADFDHV